MINSNMLEFDDAFECVRYVVVLSGFWCEHCQQCSNQVLFRKSIVEVTANLL